MLPRIGRLPVETHLPLRLIEIAEGVARRHGEAVVEQAHDAIRWLAGSVEFYPADERLIAERDEVLILGDLTLVVRRDELAVLRELDHAANDIGRRHLIEISRAIVLGRRRDGDALRLAGATAVLFGLAGTSAFGGIGVPPRGVRCSQFGCSRLSAWCSFAFSIRAGLGRQAGARNAAGSRLESGDFHAVEQHLDDGEQSVRRAARRPCATIVINVAGVHS